MRAFQIEDTKEFMHQLFQTETFHTFLMTEASVTTFASFQIDGHFHSEFLDSDERNTSREEADLSSTSTEVPAKSITAPVYCTWKMMQPQMMNLIRGKHAPLSLRIVFRLADYNVETLLRNSGLTLRPTDISGLFLNIYYENQHVTCTSGTALNIFTLDKSLEHTWDEMVAKFLKVHQLPFT